MQQACELFPPLTEIPGEPEVILGRYPYPKVSCQPACLTPLAGSFDSGKLNMDLDDICQEESSPVWNHKRLQVKLTTFCRTYSDLTLPSQVTSG